MRNKSWMKQKLTLISCNRWLIRKLNKLRKLRLNKLKTWIGSFTSSKQQSSSLNLITDSKLNTSNATKQNLTNFDPNLKPWNRSKPSKHCQLHNQTNQFNQKLRNNPLCCWIILSKRHLMYLKPNTRWTSSMSNWLIRQNRDCLRKGH